MLLLTGPSRLHRSFCDAIKKMRVYTFLFGIIEVFICRQLPPRGFWTIALIGYHCCC
jgi:hypothetical protein